MQPKGCQHSEVKKKLQGYMNKYWWAYFEPKSMKLFVKSTAPGIPSGLPSKYFPGSMLLNFTDRTKSGALMAKLLIFDSSQLLIKLD